MTVKTIFKVLLGSIVVPACGFVLVETYNLMAISNQIQNMEKIAAREACNLSMQESYVRMKIPDSIDDNYYNVRKWFMGGLFNTYSIDNELGKVGNDGELPSYIQNWQMTYFRNSSNTPDAFANMTTVLHNDEGATPNQRIEDLYYSGYILNKAFNIKTKAAWQTALDEAKITDWNDTAQIQNNIDISRAYNYYQKFYTPANIGLPYIQKYVAQQNFRYNLTALFSEYDSDRIIHYYYTDSDTSSNYGDHNHYVDMTKDSHIIYKGWQIYANFATIENISYDTYDITTDKGIEGLKNTTGIDGEKIAKNVKVEKKADDTEIRDPYLITVAHVTYKVPVKYEGVTPLKRVIAWLVNEKRVVGLGEDGSTPTITETVNVDYKDQDRIDTFNVDNAHPTSGDLYFTLVQ